MFPRYYNVRGGKFRRTTIVIIVLLQFWGFKMTQERKKLKYVEGKKKTNKTKQNLYDIKVMMELAATEVISFWVFSK